MSAETLDYNFTHDDSDDPQRTDRSSHWQERSACSQANWPRYTPTPHDPEAFFPKRLEGGQCAPAKSLCQQCPVRLECLAQGLREPTGVWGGLSEKERRTAQKMDRLGQTGPEILAYFDSLQPQRRRKSHLMGVPAAVVEQSIELTATVIESFMTTIGTVPVGLPEAPVLPATTTSMTPKTSREVSREAERRRNGL